MRHFLAFGARVSAAVPLMLFLLLFSPLFSPCSVELGVASSSVIRVPQDYSTISEAIDAADAGDTILVSSGIYYERDLSINKTLSLVGEDVNTTIIDGNGTSTNVVSVDADNVTLSGFTIRNCLRTGIGIHSIGSTIRGNVAMKCYAGIILDYSSWNSIVNNIVSNNTYVGIVLTDSDYNTIKDNEVAFNYMYGMGFGDSSFNTVTGNTIRNTLSPFMTGGGVRLYSDTGNNTFYHNNFVDNRPEDVFDEGENFWDNGCEGNYWSAYTGQDADGDGIGDTPFGGEGSGLWVEDPYPLMNPYWNPGDVNHDSKVDLNDIALACAAYSSTPLDLHWNPHCDIAGPNGKIDIYDVVRVCANYGKELENP